jgi:hypothetical protein
MSRKSPIIYRSEAKRRGLVRYFTGRPCLHGHVWTSTGICIACMNRIYGPKRLRNPEHRKYLRQWRAANPDRLRVYWRNQAERRRRSARAGNKPSR